MYYEELEKTVEQLIQPGKGILAADESNQTISKRFEAINIESNYENRRRYRSLLSTTKNLNQYISGIILYEETFDNKDDKGQFLVQNLNESGISVGIKIDKGLVDLPHTEHEKITQGLDGLSERLAKFKSLGAKFAKWRNVYSISQQSPSLIAIKAGSEVLARYASTCQSLGILPIVEPEILMDGDHSIEDCAEISELVLHELFNALFVHQIDLDHMILKPSMVTPGSKLFKTSSPEEIADFTLSVMRNNVPAAVPGIHFLSGGQKPDEATMNLNAINEISNQPWLLSFSFGRALQEECLNTWQGKEENIVLAQEKLLHRAQLCSMAVQGKYKNNP